MKKSLQERAKEFAVQLPIMENREKGELDRIIGTPMTIRDYGFLHDATKGDKEYVCFIVDEDPQYFYFGGQVLTDNIHALDEEGYHDEVIAEGLPVLFGKKKSKNNKEYTTVTFYPEA